MIDNAAMLNNMMDEPTPTPDQQPLLEEAEMPIEMLRTTIDEGVADAVPESPVSTEPDGNVSEPLVEETPQLTLWERVRRWLLPGRDDMMARLNDLTDAIAMSPETASNYVLRGELYLEMREYQLAEADFQQGYDLAVAQFETADWGVMEQVMRDRALMGLQKVR
ncbi:MAG: hypothetical protein R3E39_13175 [Anaerolineae bacterium]